VRNLIRLITELSTHETVMTNLSLQMSNPKFLSDDFTTQFDLTTGKLYYESPWGKLFAMMPPEIAEAISQSIWRNVFSLRVLKIHKPLKISWDGEDPSDYARARCKTVYSNGINWRHNPTHGQSEVMIKARLDFAESRGDCFIPPHRFVENGHKFCCCLNKNGQICGQESYESERLWENCEGYDDKSVIPVPQYTMGIKKHRPLRRGHYATLGDPSVRSEIRIPMCKKHSNEFCEAEFPEEYLNDILKKYGWGESHGYPIRLNTNRLKPSKGLQKKLDKRCNSRVDCRKPIVDVVSETLGERSYGFLEEGKTSFTHRLLFINDPSERLLYDII